MTSPARFVWARSLDWWPLWVIGSLLGLALSLWFSLRPGGVLLHISDKWQHLAGYAVLMLWFCGLVRREYHWRLLLACIAYSALIEVLQGTLTTTREADPYDVLANGLGAVLALMIGRFGLDRWAEWIERRGGHRP